MAKANASRSASGQLRIIGGSWRGRKLRFTAQQGLRPTADRTRETLFNWLVADVHGAHCADLFAGSGALGLEALSRGASSCDFVDCSAVATEQISDHLSALQATARGTCYNQQAAQFLQAGRGPYDIVFIDPPFRKGLIEAVCKQLDALRLLRPQARIYIETGADEAQPEIPESWTPLREKNAGGVTYRLYSADP